MQSPSSPHNRHLETPPLHNPETEKFNFPLELERAITSMMSLILKIPNPNLSQKLRELMGTITTEGTTKGTTAENTEETTEKTTQRNLTFQNLISKLTQHTGAKALKSLVLENKPQETNSTEEIERGPITEKAFCRRLLSSKKFASEFLTLLFKRRHRADALLPLVLENKPQETNSTKELNWGPELQRSTEEAFRLRLLSWGGFALELLAPSFKRGHRTKEKFMNRTHENIIRFPFDFDLNDILNALEQTIQESIGKYPPTKHNSETLYYCPFLIRAENSGKAVVYEQPQVYIQPLKGSYGQIENATLAVIEIAPEKSPIDTAFELYKEGFRGAGVIIKQGKNVIMIWHHGLIDGQQSAEFSTILAKKILKAKKYTETKQNTLKQENEPYLGKYNFFYPHWDEVTQLRESINARVNRKLSANQFGIVLMAIAYEAIRRMFILDDNTFNQNLFDKVFPKERYTEIYKITLKGIIASIGYFPIPFMQLPERGENPAIPLQEAITTIPVFKILDLVQKNPMQLVEELRQSVKDQGKGYTPSNFVLALIAQKLPKGMFEKLISALVIRNSRFLGMRLLSTLFKAKRDEILKSMLLISGLGHVSAPGFSSEDETALSIQISIGALILTQIVSLMMALKDGNIPVLSINSLMNPEEFKKVFQDRIKEVLAELLEHYKKNEIQSQQ